MLYFYYIVCCVIIDDLLENRGWQLSQSRLESVVVILCFGYFQRWLTMEVKHYKEQFLALREVCYHFLQYWLPELLLVLLHKITISNILRGESFVLQCASHDIKQTTTVALFFTVYSMSTHFGHLISEAYSVIGPWKLVFYFLEPSH